MDIPAGMSQATYMNEWDGASAGLATAASRDCAEWLVPITSRWSIRQAGPSTVEPCVLPRRMAPRAIGWHQCLRHACTIDIRRRRNQARRVSTLRPHRRGGSHGIRTRLGGAVIDVLTALWIGRGLWRLYRGRLPWQPAHR